MSANYCNCPNCRTENCPAGEPVQKDYDRLSDAAIWLRRACKDRLPPGHYAKLDDECRAIDVILQPNGRSEP